MSTTARAEVSIGMGLATAAIATAVFNLTLPSLAEVRVTEQNDPQLSAAERTATWVAAGVVTAVSLLSQDPTVFVLGGVTVIALAWMHRHANMVHPEVGTATMPMPADTPQTYADNVYPAGAGG
jgi:hypothetical protein